MEVRHYTYRILWSQEDEEYVGLCEEFPFLSWVAGTQEAALDGIVSVVKDVVRDMNESGEDLPHRVAA